MSVILNTLVNQILSLLAKKVVNILEIIFFVIHILAKREKHAELEQEFHQQL